MASLAEIRAKLTQAEARTSNNSQGGGDNAIYPHWNISFFWEIGRAYV